MMNPAYRPGHLAIGSLALQFVRHHAACKLCGLAFDGSPNQQMCNECRKSDAGKAVMKARKKAVIERWKRRQRSAAR